MREMAAIQNCIIIIGNRITSYLSLGEVPQVAQSDRTLTDMIQDITSFRSFISCDLNTGNGEGTPKINRCLFGRANSGCLFLTSTGRLGTSISGAGW